MGNLPAHLDSTQKKKLSDQGEPLPVSTDCGTRHMTSFYNETLLSHSSQTCEMQSNQSKPVHGRFTHLCCRGDDSNAGLHGEASQAVQNPIK